MRVREWVWVREDKGWEEQEEEVVRGAECVLVVKIV
jgi:hypothetical protein